MCILTGGEYDCCSSSKEGLPENGKQASYYNNLNQARTWETDMCHACCNNPLGCFVAICFPCCCGFHLRRRALQYDMSKYKCCQGYCCYDSLCCQTCEQNCPNVTLCCELYCCMGIAASSTRMYVQDERQIATDACDIRLIRFNNLMQCLSCICHILAIVSDIFDTAACIIDILADIVYYTTLACMQAQTHLELDRHPTPQDYGPVQQQPRNI